jgi:aryl-alcohol dehydrogenase-like predicted oxidoreductase
MIPKLSFGRTGHSSSRVVFGSYALSNATQAEADQVLKLLLEHGINHIDTAPMYGKAEQRIGAWMDMHRDDFFIATKTRSRTYQGAWDNLNRSLDRLRVNRIDLWQMHGLTNPVGWERAMEGTLQAFVEAREQGLVRFLGVTGHGVKVPEMHLRSLERFDFDSVMLPYNYVMMQKPKYAANFHALVSLCSERGVALQTIKAIARQPWKRRSRTYNTYFYEPLVEYEAIDRAVHWALGLPGSFLVSAGDMRLIPGILKAASRMDAVPGDAELEADREKYEIKSVFP